MASLRVPACVPTAAEDAEHLRKAFAGLGTNEASVIRILAHRNAAQKKLIRDAYSALYNEDLLKELEKEISGDFERAMLLWTLDPSERDAQLANEALKKNSSSSNFVIMEIACTRPPHDLVKVRQAYHARYRKSLEEDVYSYTTGDLRKLLVPLVSTFRYDGDEVNKTVAKSEAKILHNKITHNAFADEELIRIISTRSKAQLNATLNHYNDLFGNCIKKDLKADSKPDGYLTLLRATIKCLTTPEKYYEKALRGAMKGLGTDERTLTRVIVTQAESNMLKIKEEYYKRNSTPLEKALAGDTSGDYQKLLIVLVAQHDA